MTVEEREKQIRDAIVDELRKRVEAHYAPRLGGLFEPIAVPEGLQLACTIDVLIRRQAELEERLEKAEQRALAAAMP